MPSTIHAKPNDFRWAAGFWEGDGSCRGKIVQVNIPQKQRWPLERMCELFGGSVSTNRNSNGVFYWSISGARARGFIQSIYGELSTRRQKQVRMKGFVHKLPNDEIIV